MYRLSLEIEIENQKLVKRKRYAQEFKQVVVKEAVEVGNAAQVARRHDITTLQFAVFEWVDGSFQIGVCTLRHVVGVVFALASWG